MENPRIRVKDTNTEHFIRFVNNLEILPPKEIFNQVKELGYCGQEDACRSLSLMAYRHVKRIKRIHLEGTPRETLLPKSNCLMVGPTGCGKTFLVDLLFSKVLKLPTTAVDITNYSETGYVGQDTSSILTRLLHAAGDNPLIAAVGVVFIDEFDKVASGMNNATFAGAGTTKDVTGMGVQRELLKMLEAAEVVVPTELDNSNFSNHVIMPTADIAFIAAGAFSGMSSVVRSGEDRGIGFGAEVSKDERSFDTFGMSRAQAADAMNFQSYGLMPELVGRFSSVVPLQPLSRDVLKDILHRSVVSKMTEEFEDEGYLLDISDEVLDHIVQQSLDRRTGARGLTSSLHSAIEGIAFECFAQGQSGKVSVFIENGNITIQRD